MGPIDEARQNGWYEEGVRFCFGDKVLPTLKERVENLPKTAWKRLECPVLKLEPPPGGEGNRPPQEPGLRMVQAPVPVNHSTRNEQSHDQPPTRNTNPPPGGINHHAPTKLHKSLHAFACLRSRGNNEIALFLKAAL